VIPEELVVGKLMLDEKHDQYTTRNSYCQPKYVDSGVNLLLQEVSERYSELVLDHGRGGDWLMVIGLLGNSP
jgi:hypothetical protein